MTVATAITLEMLQAKAREIGFDVCGVARPSIDARNQKRLDEFVAGGEYGSMDWMNDPERLPRRRDPVALWPDVKSVIVLGSNYGPAENPMALLDHPDRAMISVYAKNKDYHDLIKKRLKQLARWLMEQAQKSGAGGEQVKVFVDTAPVLEKPLGQSAGIGCLVLAGRASTPIWCRANLAVGCFWARCSQRLSLRKPRRKSIIAGRVQNALRPVRPTRFQRPISLMRANASHTSPSNMMM